MGNQLSFFLLARSVASSASLPTLKRAIASEAPNIP